MFCWETKICQCLWRACHRPLITADTQSALSWVRGWNWSNSIPLDILSKPKQVNVKASILSMALVSWWWVLMLKLVCPGWRWSPASPSPLATSSSSFSSVNSPGRWDGNSTHNRRWMLSNTIKKAAERDKKIYMDEAVGQEERWTRVEIRHWLWSQVIAPLNPGLVKTALNEAIAAADLCGCCFELIISKLLHNLNLQFIPVFAQHMIINESKDECSIMQWIFPAISYCLFSRRQLWTGSLWSLSFPPHHLVVHGNHQII